VLSILFDQPGEPVAQLKTAQEAKDSLAKGTGVLWVDIQGRSDESDAVLREVFGFHELAIEDVYNEHHRPKVEDYDEYLYLIVMCLAETWTLEEIETVEVDVFLGKNFVVTHHNGAAPELASVRNEIVVGKSEVMDKGAAFLAHMILDRVVDRLRPLGDGYMTMIDSIETRVMKGEDELARIMSLIGGLQTLRRMTALQRDVLARMARAEFDEVPAETKPFFRDVHEHMAELADTLDVQRDELNAVFNAFHSLSSHRMNEIMKVLTLVSTIMLPLTFLVGVYGMNFDEMPELHTQGGYYVLWGVMITISVGMTLYFKMRRWL
jgi:magnesium transporter